jgi:dolichol-phosphate mannosyltransferase
MSRRVVDDLCRLQEHNPFIRGLVTWVGYNQTAVLYDREARRHGSTKFSTAKMFKFAFDGITSFSSRPLRVASLVGMFFAVASLVLMVVLTAYKLLGGTGLVTGWTSLIVAILFLGGLQMMAVGLLGEYVGRIYDQVKGRPVYLVQERANLLPRRPPPTRRAATAWRDDDASRRRVVRPVRRRLRAAARRPDAPPLRR